MAHVTGEETEAGGASWLPTGTHQVRVRAGESSCLLGSRVKSCGRMTKLGRHPSAAPNGMMDPARMVRGCGNHKVKSRVREAAGLRGGWALLGSQLHPSGQWDQAGKQEAGC